MQVMQISNLIFCFTYNRRRSIRLCTLTRNLNIAALRIHEIHNIIYKHLYKYVAKFIFTLKPPPSPTLGKNEVLISRRIRLIDISNARPSKHLKVLLEVVGAHVLGNTHHILFKALFYTQFVITEYYHDA